MEGCSYPISCLVVSALLGSWSSKAQARWSHQQADRPDNFANLGDEYYNDILSYRLWPSWVENWHDKNAAFLASAGSINDKDFAYEEYIALRSPSEKAWQLAFEGKREENPIHSQTQSEIELSHGSPDWRLGLLAEAHGEKSYSDLGLSARIPGEAFSMRASLWAVDPFYSDKKTNVEDEREKDIWSSDIHLAFKKGPWLFTWLAKDDSPVLWKRGSIGAVYRYSRREQKPRIAYRDGTEAYYLELDRVEQKESIERAEQPQAYEHRRTEWELGTLREWGRLYLWGHKSRTDYQGGIPGFDATVREEFALVGQRLLPLGDSEKHKQVLGLVLNQVYNREEKSERSTEAKFQWSLDLQLNEQSRLTLGTTWDIDQFIDDVSKRSLTLAWGGGYGQVLLAF